MENYIVIQKFMREQLNLSGNKLFVFAIIYGFTQDAQSKFFGGSKYLENWTGTTPPTIWATLKELEEKNLILKEFCNGKICYSANLDCVKNFNTGTETQNAQNAQNAQSAKNPQKTPENGAGNKEGDNLTLKLQDAQKTENLIDFETFWETYPHKRRAGKPQCIKKWNNLNAQTREKIIEHLKRATAENTDWSKENFTYCPLSTTYLNQERWEQEVSATPTPTPTQTGGLDYTKIKQL